jgi:hypothetical protein
LYRATALPLHLPRPSLAQNVQLNKGQQIRVERNYWIFSWGKFNQFTALQKSHAFLGQSLP